MWPLSCSVSREHCVSRAVSQGQFGEIERNEEPMITAAHICDCERVRARKDSPHAKRTVRQPNFGPQMTRKLYATTGTASHSPSVPSFRARTVSHQLPVPVARSAWCSGDEGPVCKRAAVQPYTKLPTHASHITIEDRRGISKRSSIPAPFGGGGSEQRKGPEPTLTVVPRVPGSCVQVSDFMRSSSSSSSA